MESNEGTIFDMTSTSNTASKKVGQKIWED